ncbi:DNA-binding transcriptional regulator CsiR [Agrobacterium sp. DSM 25558]|uniref:GntR family transcriptional regulator n=1 Tax=Agrobacterium sp. DSM 25558 TaxID=1907665 RepID=UPI0009725AAC|nr:GntR family transcriptional regulator [Agrobacterium sp. DSM 25558]SCX22947.1 DNA-binding transcriptional regulator CsiR [Agrobacterium sp. DSM 25558]
MIERHVLDGNLGTATCGPSNVKSLNSVYCRLKKMLIHYEFRPGQQLHIAELVETLSTSTTPLREALMRLQAERFVTATPNKGFFAKTLSSMEMRAWYEAAFLVLKYSIQCASRADRPWGIAGSISAWLPLRPFARDADLIEICAAKESLYEDISRWSNNQIMLDHIRDFNAHSRFVRMLDLEIPENIEAITDDMTELSMALRDLDAESAIANLEGQLEKKLGRLDLLAKEGTVRSLGFASIPHQSFNRHPLI